MKWRATKEEILERFYKVYGDAIVRVWDENAKLKNPEHADTTNVGFEGGMDFQGAIQKFISQSLDRIEAQTREETAREIKMSIAREYDSYEMLSYAEVMKHIEKYTKGETK